MMKFILSYMGTIMGSFSVSCSVSRISIDYGDPIVFLPLNKAKYCDGFNQRILVSNEGPCYAFEPATLPVFGTYNDYGFVAIEEDANTKAIERYTVLTIDYFINEFEVMREPSSQFFDAGMYIHRSIYDYMVKHSPRVHPRFVRDLLLEGDIGLDQSVVDEIRTLTHDLRSFSFDRVIESLMFKRFMSDEERNRLIETYGFTKSMNDELVQLFADFNSFLRSCLLNNTVLMPWAQHTQHGEKAQLDFLESYMDVMRKKHAEFLLYEEEDYFEDYYDEED